MLGIYNQSFNNMYLNQSYGYQQPSFDINSLFTSLISSLFGYQQPTNNYALPGVNINNSGNIGSINISSLFGNLLRGRTPINIDQETVEITPKEKVFIIGGYNNKVGLSLEDNIKDFFNSGSTQRSSNGGTDPWFQGANYHNNVSSNDEMLKTLLNNLSKEDKQKTIKNGEAYIITESGKILGTTSSAQVADKETFRDKALPTVAENKYFEIIEDLGMLKTPDSALENYKQYGAEEAVGGKIKFNGQTYEVASTVVRKVTPLTFDLNGDGVKTSDKVVEYDIDGDGKLDKINDVADGTLCIRGGKDGKDLFGDNTDLNNDGKADGYANGFEALKALASKEGLINGKDDMKLDAKDLKILEDKYQFGMKTNGYNSKEKSFEELGITEINLGAADEVTKTENFDGKNNDVLQQDGATFKINSKEREYADVLHEIKS